MLAPVPEPAQLSHVSCKHPPARCAAIPPRDLGGSFFPGKVWDWALPLVCRRALALISAWPWYVAAVVRCCGSTDACCPVCASARQADPSHTPSLPRRFESGVQRGRPPCSVRGPLCL